MPPRKNYYFDRQWVPQLANAYVFEKEGGRTEVKMTSGNDSVWIDNVGANGRMYENKLGAVAGGGHASNELAIFNKILEDSPGTSLDYNFFKSPSTGEFGPTRSFSCELADSMVVHNIGERIYSHDWWEELQ